MENNRKVTLEIDLPTKGTPSKSGKSEIYVSENGRFSKDGQQFRYTLCVYAVESASQRTSCVSVR